MKRSWILVLVASGVATLISSTNVVPARAQTTVNPNPVRGFYVIPTGQFINVQLSTELTDIQRISLPKGRYIVNASAVVYLNNSLSPVEVACIFMIDGLTVSQQARATIGGTHPAEIVTLPLTVGLRIFAPKDLSLACQTSEPVPTFAEVGTQSSPISAVRVDALTVSECCE